MPVINYNIKLVDPEGLETISTKDREIIESFEVNGNFLAFENKIEAHIFSIDGELLESDYNYNRQRFLAGAQQKGVATALTIDPVEDIKHYGYNRGDVKVVYNFLDDLYSKTKKNVQFFIEEISEDRTELRLLTNDLDNEEIKTITDQLSKDLDNSKYFSDIRVNLQNNDLYIGLNIATQEYKENTSVIIKLYEPLPTQYTVKDKVSIDTLKADSLGYEITSDVIDDEIIIPKLKGPNFNPETIKDTQVPTAYLNYDDLFSFPTNETYRQLQSLFAEKSAEISVDYTDFNNFILFSNAEERLRNFHYKLNLLESYQKAYDSASNASNNTAGYSGSTQFYSDKIDTITKNFDHYERHLYYESGSYAWPKQSPYTKPYTIATGSATGSFYSSILASASIYDTQNVNQLVNAIPEFIKDDTQNAPYSTFTYMIGQHFDNLWIYTKALSDKYDADNRMTNGIPKGLVEDALKSFGIKLYSSNNSIENLFKNYTGELYNTGSETVTNFISASNDIESLDDYKLEIYKRIYHNLPLLLKSKGTERGIRALINTFGIPNLNSSGSYNGLQVRMYGGLPTSQSGVSNFGNLGTYSSSLDKIRIDNTGSILGSTLHRDTSIIKQDYKFGQDITTIDVGFSQSDVLDIAIQASSSNFNIDDYIGDPDLQSSGSFEALNSFAKTLVGDSIRSGSSDDAGDFTRSFKFMNNVLFKMIKDFLPARSSVNTGLIIKPHALNRSKVKYQLATGSQAGPLAPQAIKDQLTGNMEFTGSTATASRDGGSGGSFLGVGRQEQATPLTASYNELVITPDGIQTKTYHNHEEARYDGELSGTTLVASTGELNDENTFKDAVFNLSKYAVDGAFGTLFVAPPSAPQTLTLTIVTASSFIYPHPFTASFGTAPSESINEGSSSFLVLSASGYPAGTTFYYSASGDFGSGDFYHDGLFSGQNITGSMVTNADGMARAHLSVLSDQTTEGNESGSFYLVGDVTSSITITSESVNLTINDTSQFGVLPISVTGSGTFSGATWNAFMNDGQYTSGYGVPAAIDSTVDEGDVSGTTVTDGIAINWNGSIITWNSVSKIISVTGSLVNSSGTATLLNNSPQTRTNPGGYNIGFSNTVIPIFFDGSGNATSLASSFTLPRDAQDGDSLRIEVNIT